MKEILIVLQYPDEVSLEEIKDYAQMALERWGGQRHPDDNLFYTTKAYKSRMKPIKTSTPATPHLVLDNKMVS